MTSTWHKLGVSIGWHIIVVGGCENGVSQHALVVEASHVQRQEDVQLACEQVAHTEAEQLLASGVGRDAQEDEALALRQRLGVVEQAGGVADERGEEPPVAIEDGSRRRDEGQQNQAVGARRRREEQQAATGGGVEHQAAAAAGSSPREADSRDLASRTDRDGAPGVFSPLLALVSGPGSLVFGPKINGGQWISLGYD
uniref:Uncharacterized protein n=1 Tax=Setaria viridis TaxID=4556 RepID=A0A4U6TNF3_SETVI|nr:hypothetical protein SEVIR_7G091125v2 [Setaria viridis]